MLENGIEKLTIFTDGHYELSTETTVALSQNLLKKENSICIHYRNIRSLAIELYKVKHTVSNSLILNIFPLKITISEHKLIS